MNPITKSNINTVTRCPKAAWLTVNNPKVSSFSVNKATIASNEEVEKYANDLYQVNDIVHRASLGDMESVTNDYLNKGSLSISKATFSYNGCYCTIDILIKNANGNYDIIEVKNKCMDDKKKRTKYITPELLLEMGYQFTVATNSGVPVDSVKVLFLNKQYTRVGKIDLSQLFTLEDVTLEIVRDSGDTEQKIKDAINYSHLSQEPDYDIGLYCLKEDRCDYFEYCSRNLAKPNVFEIAGMSKEKMIDLYSRDIITFEDILNRNMINDDKFMRQITHELNNNPHIEVDKIKGFLDGLHYPLYFLDFETFQPSIPLYDGTHPIQRIPFQYSIHFIEKQGGILQHKEYLGNPDADPRLGLAEGLIQIIPEDACVLAYYSSFERVVIESLVKEFPQFKTKLEAILANLQDLIIPFKQQFYYVKGMKGYSSIKYVLPALYPTDPELNYSNLSKIHNGLEASEGYFEMLSMSNVLEIDKQRKALLAYCELDTLAMYKVWLKLNDVM